MPETQTPTPPPAAPVKSDSDEVIFVNVNGKPNLVTRAKAASLFKQETDTLRWGDTPKSRIVEPSDTSFPLLKARSLGQDYDTDHGRKLSDAELAAKLGVKP